MTKQYKKTRNMTMTAAFMAIIIIMAVVPFLGYIPLGFMNATIIHIPVIIGSILLGYKSGILLGFTFGITSMIKNTVTPNATSFVFSPLIPIPGIENRSFMTIMGTFFVCVLSRVMIPVAGRFFYQIISGRQEREGKRDNIALIFAGVIGSLTNTILVMAFIYIFFGKSYSMARNIPYESLYLTIITLVGTQGIGEAIVAGILTLTITRVLMKVRDNI